MVGGTTTSFLTNQEFLSLTATMETTHFSNLSIYVDNTTNLTLNTDPPLPDDNFDYYDISDRAQRFLTQPVMLIALICGVIVVIANILSLVVLAHVRSPLTSQFLLISSLACSDILVGVSVLLHLTHKVLSPSYYPGYGPWAARLRSRCGFMIIKALNTTAVNITLLNLMGMAIDHYVAIIQPLMHSVRMSRRRCSTMIFVFWGIAVLCGFSDFFSVLGEMPNYLRYKNKFNYCEFIWLGDYQEEYTLFALALACLFTMLFIYVRIYWEVHYRPMSWPPQQELQRSKKALITTLLILGTFILCVMPNCIFQITMIISVKYNPEAIQRNEYALRKADQYLYDLVLLNSLCDPLIYAFRIREVRNGYLKLSRCCLRRVKEPWGAGSEPNSVINSATYEEQRKLSKSFPAFERKTSQNSSSSKAYLLWPWQKETNV